MPLYAMGTVILPTKVVKKLTSLVRNFFWGGTVEDRKMAYVAWREITLPKGMGGLGLRGLGEMNQALVLKNVWKIVSGSTARWVLIMQSKYYPRSCFLATNRTNNCTKMWRNLVQLKPLLYEHLAWKIGSGEEIPIFSQPWFQHWWNFTARNQRQHNARLSEMIDAETGGWDFEKLESLFGFQQALIISLSPGSTPALSNRPDVLLFTYAKNGSFSVSKAYQLVRGEMGNPSDKDFWMGIWNLKGLLPKLRLFLWRCACNALPVKSILNARIQSIQPLCQLCNCHDETIRHALFDCNFARVCWAASGLGIMPDNIPGTFREVLIAVKQQLSDEDITCFVCVAWGLWRVRNDAVLGGKQQSLTTFKQYCHLTAEACQTLAYSLQREQSGTGTLPGSLEASAEIECFVDGSWSEDSRARIGLYLTIRGEQSRWVSKSIQAINPVQVEARAVLEALNLMQGLNLSDGTIYSDSTENGAISHAESTSAV